MLKRALRGKLVSQDIRIGQGCYQFVATCHQDGPDGTDPLVILLTNTTWKQRKVLSCYRIRWCTEPLFRHLKSNGFELEAMGFENRQKIRLLVAMVVVLYVICVAEGLKHFERIGRKRYANGSQYGSESVFRVGYGVVAIQLATIEHFMEWLLNAMRQKVKVPRPAI